MTITAPSPRVTERSAQAMSVLMCRPSHFTVSYRINPWMDPDSPTDTGRAVTQWEQLRETYRSLGFEVREISPIDGLPDMVFAANGGLVIDDVAYTASFHYPQRQPEGPAYGSWFAAAGLTVHYAQYVNEGEGDFLPIGDVILAGHGFRTDTASHVEAASVFGREVLPLELVRPEFYHLDTALTILDRRPGAEHIAYLPGAFSEQSLAELRRRFPDAIEVSEADAAVFGLNAVSDGLHVITASAATGFHAQLRDHGYTPIGVDLTELLLGGGGVKCCTLELRSAPGKES
ncbi:N-dimethylarginine dimethylaminohydrolase [Demequina sp. TTPB684]|uniref:dimethylargininase n=1 Tax=unclassified Demequina TaxID=2620311 RepID=UPI001CF383B4|nr:MULTISPECIES: dimethylargininase [unclassified Demequina]MCB2413380.1 N-dimethylarginine dimethylaminohydrolase [Demequina sp. TTPB684]UPU87393.1 arginine deiminase-related protein [Demequina sp. TMPB413]